MPTSLRTRYMRSSACDARRSRSVFVAKVLDEPIALERSAEKARAKLTGLSGDRYDAQWRLRREASETVQAAVTAHAEATGASREQGGCPARTGPALRGQLS